MKYWGMNQRIKFGFSGGESTFNPDYLEFVEYLKSQGHIIHTTTNGSHQPDYYSKLMLVSDITVSAHLDYLQQPRMYQKFLDNIQAAAHSKVSRPESNTNILEVRIMLQPGKLDQAQKLYQDLIPITSNVTVDLLHDKKKKIMDYSQSELAWTTSTISARQQPETDF
jgi:organic radical activating enzyme